MQRYAGPPTAAHRARLARLSPELRRIAPSIPIYGNLGAIQLVNGMGLDDARRAVGELGADALILHLNPVQEAVQPGGDRNWSGVEAAIDLAGIVGHVTLLEFDSTLRADEVLQRKLRSLPNVTIITEAQTTEVTGDGNKVNGMVYTDRKSGESKAIELEGIFVQIGLLPNTDWIKGTVALSKHGEIEVDAKGQTSVPGVFAAGDVTTVPYKQIIIAMGEGSKAALSAFDHLIRTSAPAEQAQKLAA